MKFSKKKLVLTISWIAPGDPEAGVNDCEAPSKPSFLEIQPNLNPATVEALRLSLDSCAIPADRELSRVASTSSSHGNNEVDISRYLFCLIYPELCLPSRLHATYMPGRGGGSRCFRGCFNLLNPWPE